MIHSCSTVPDLTIVDLCQYRLIRGTFSVDWFALSSIIAKIRFAGNTLTCGGVPSSTILDFLSRRWHKFRTLIINRLIIGISISRFTSYTNFFSGFFIIGFAMGDGAQNWLLIYIALAIYWFGVSISPSCLTLCAFILLIVGQAVGYDCFRGIFFFIDRAKTIDWLTI